MRIFERDSKTNFVDANNVFVGFDSYQSCCEDFGYMLTKQIPAMIEDRKIELSEQELEPYCFDKSFVMDLPASVYWPSEDGGAKCFKLTNGQDEIYLTIYNYHNGYYSHGFVFVDNETMIQDGSL